MLRIFYHFGRTGALLSGLCLPLLAGCGDGIDLGQVNGRVTLNGQPLPKARVIFLPTAGGRPGTARTDSDGRYELQFDGSRKGAPLGRHEVKISTYYPPVQEFDDDGKLVLTPEMPERLPARYHAKSELTAEVNSQISTVNFDLKSE